MINKLLKNKNTDFLNKSSMDQLVQSKIPSYNDPLSM